MTDFAHLQEYIAQLPSGLDSYPACRTKASIYRTYLSRHPIDPQALKGVPQPLAQLVTHPVPISSWIPAAHSLAMTILFRDLFAATDTDFKKLVRNDTAAMYATGIYRAVMVVVSPERLIKTASARWSKFNRGSTMSVVESDARSALIRFEYPPNLYAQAHYAPLEGALLAALELAGARAVRVAVRPPMSKSSVTFAFSWL